MISLHHVTHAVCLVIIAVLLKKYTELQSLHSDLKFEHNQLKLSCGSTPPGGGAEMQAGLCSCPSQSGYMFAPSQTDIKSQFHALSESSRQGSSVSDREMFANVLNPSDDPVDDFGRSLADAADYSDAGGEIQGSATSAGVFLPEPKLPPLNQPPKPVPVVLTSSEGISTRTGASEPAAAQQRGDGWTESGQQTPVSFHTTSESLESVKLSPSSISARITVKSSVVDHHANVAERDVEENDNNFYLGSESSEDGVGEEINVIVTSAEGTLNTAFYPHGVRFSQENYDDDMYYEEWEEEVEQDAEEQEEPHPAFGNVHLQWLSEGEVERMSTQGSSVHCTGTTVSDRICQFSDLCFKPQTREFVFLLSPRSVQDNVPPLKPQQALLELSTVAGHNAQYFSYLSLPSSDVKGFQVGFVSSTTIVFKRFKPDNIMHVLHDDVIPLFHTLNSQKIKPRPGIGGEKFPVSLFLADENSEGEFYDLYDAFAADDAFTLNSLIASVAKTNTSNTSLICFSEALVGLSKTTTWYQYGFFEPQSPLPNSDAKSQHLHSVSAYLLNSITKDCPICGSGGHLVLVSRKETRRILNEMDLVLAISKEFRVKVMTVSLDTLELAEIVPIIHSSRGIIGMHGSLLSLAMFLKQGSIMIELFPYAVNPANYTPYKTLCQIPGMLIAYRAWVNQDLESSVPHPDWPAEFGGLYHLPHQQQQEVASQVDSLGFMCVCVCVCVCVCLYLCMYNVCIHLCLHVCVGLCICTVGGGEGGCLSLLMRVRR